MQRMEIRQTAQAIRGGGQLTVEQEDVVVRNREIFGDRARQIAEQRGRAGGFEQVLADVGGDARLRDNERRAREAGQLQQQLNRGIEQDLRVGEGQRAREAAQREQQQIGNIGVAQQQRHEFQRFQAMTAQGGGLAPADLNRERVWQGVDAMLATQRAGLPQGQQAGLAPQAVQPQPQAMGQAFAAAMAAQFQANPPPWQAPGGQPGQGPQLPAGPALAPLASDVFRDLIPEIRQLQQPAVTQVQLLTDVLTEARKISAQEPKHELTVQFRTDIQAALNVQAGEMARQIAEQVAPKIRELTTAMVAELRRQLQQFQQDQAFNQVF